MNSEHFAQHAAGNQNDKRPEQHMNADRLAGRFFLAQRRGQQQPTGDIGRGDPEEGQLEMPGTQNIARQVLRQIDTVKITGFRAVVCQRAADHDLGKKQQRNNKTILNERFLAVGDSSRQHVGMKDPGIPFPAKVVESAECKQHQRQPGQQHDDAQSAPEKGIGCKIVADHRVIGEVVGIRIGFIRAFGNTGPGSPGKKGRQLTNLFWVVDVFVWKTRICLRLKKIIGPDRDLSLVGSFFGIREGQLF